MKADRILLLAGGGIGLAIASLLPVPAAFIWNRTASMPTGLYSISPRPAYLPGDVIAYSPSPEESRLLEERRYTGRNWPMIKRVAAGAGASVCRHAGEVYIDGRRAASALTSDREGQRLPVWQGCRELGAEDVFLLGDAPRSIDGRYFGIQKSRRIFGEARPVWIIRTIPASFAPAPDPRPDPPA